MLRPLLLIDVLLTTAQSAPARARLSIGLDVVTDAWRESLLSRSFRVEPPKQGGCREEGPPPLPHPRVRETPVKYRRTRRRDPRVNRALRLKRPRRIHDTKMRLITRIAFGFTSPDALDALAMFCLGGHKPVLAGRN